MIKQNCEFFKELTYDKQVAKSVAIADAIEDKEIKATVQARIMQEKKIGKAFPAIVTFSYYAIAITISF